MSTIMKRYEKEFVNTIKEFYGIDIKLEKCILGFNEVMYLTPENFDGVIYYNSTAMNVEPFFTLLSKVYKTDIETIVKSCAIHEGRHIWQRLNNIETENSFDNGVYDEKQAMLNLAEQDAYEIQRKYLKGKLKDATADTRFSRTLKGNNNIIDKLLVKMTLGSIKLVNKINK